MKSPVAYLFFQTLIIPVPNSLQVLLYKWVGRRAGYCNFNAFLEGAFDFAVWIPLVKWFEWGRQSYK